MAKCKWYKKNVLFCGRQSIAIFPFVMAGLNFDVKIDITRCYGSVFGQKELLFNYNNIALGHLAVRFLSRISPWSCPRDSIVGVHSLTLLSGLFPRPTSQCFNHAVNRGSYDHTGHSISRPIYIYATPFSIYEIRMATWPLFSSQLCLLLSAPISFQSPRAHLSKKTEMAFNQNWSKQAARNGAGLGNARKIDRRQS